MTSSTHRTKAAILLSFIFLLTTTSFAQNRTLPEQDWYGDIKRALAIYYIGKTVKVKMMIPATRRGVELLDGTLQNNAGPQPQPIPVAAQPGDELIIKGFRVSDNDIEVTFGKGEAPQKNRIAAIFSMERPPRINLRFTRELAAKDLTVENINRLLATAVDVSSLAMPVVEKGAGSPQASIASPQAETTAKAEEHAGEQNLPHPTIVGDLPSLNADLGELTIETLTKPARIYIDGAYSGLAPRTLRLRAGVHTILVVSDGHAPWEQKLFIPGGKASVVQAELQRAMR